MPQHRPASDPGPVRVAVAVQAHALGQFGLVRAACEGIGLRTEYALAGVGILTGFIRRTQIARLRSVAGVELVALPAESRMHH